MNPIQEHIELSRREFLATAASGVGGLAVSSLLQQDGLAAAETGVGNPLKPKPSHFAPKAKSCIFIYLAGAPSQIDLFTPKPKLKEMAGQILPDSITKNVRFAFINKSTKVFPSPREFKRYGESGMYWSDRLPHLSACSDDICRIESMHTEAFNHHPGQLLMNCGHQKFGHPSMGSWINYGLGSESENLPGYVVLTAGPAARGGATNWSSGVLPSTYQGVLFRNQGEPVLNLNNPAGMTTQGQRKSLDALAELNRLRHDRLGDPEIYSRIAAYELAFRMQMAAPELIDLKKENPQLLEDYGVNRSGVQGSFARNCILARRMVERASVSSTFITAVGISTAISKRRSSRTAKSSTNRWLRSFATSSSVGCSTIRLWCGAPSSAVHLSCKARTAAIITRSPSPSGWPAAGHGAVTSMASRTTSAGASPRTRCTSTTSRPPCLTCSAWTTSVSPTASKAWTSALPVRAKTKAKLCLN